MACTFRSSHQAMGIRQNRFPSSALEVLDIKRAIAWQIRDWAGVHRDRRRVSPAVPPAARPDVSPPFPGLTEYVTRICTDLLPSHGIIPYGTGLAKHFSRGNAPYLIRVSSRHDVKHLKRHLISKRLAVEEALDLLDHRPALTMAGLNRGPRDMGCQEDVVQLPEGVIGR